MWDYIRLTRKNKRDERSEKKMCDKNVIGRQNNIINMRKWKTKNIRKEKFEKRWDVLGKEDEKMTWYY